MAIGVHKEQAEQVRQNRENVYGRPSTTLTQLAAHWTALLRSYFQDEAFPALPPHLVGLMLVCLKLHRAAAPFPKRDRDSYVDTHNYLDFAEELDPTLPKAGCGCPPEGHDVHCPSYVRPREVRALAKGQGCGACISGSGGGTCAVCKSVWAMATTVD